VTPERFSRRALLGGAAAGTAGLGVGAAVGWAAADEQLRPTASLTSVRGWHGLTQPAIAERGRASTMLASFTCVAPDQAALKLMFKELGAEAHRLCDGLSEGPLDEDLPPPTTGILGSDSSVGTSVAVSVGASLFNHRFGLADRKPAELVEMPYLVNDRLDPAWTHGDVLVLIAADREDQLFHAVRQIARSTREYLITNWVINGFNHVAPSDRLGRVSNRNTLGFKDGTANLDMGGADADFVWVGSDLNDGAEPAWTENGTYQVVRLIRTLVEQWDRASLGEQEGIIGRDKVSGAPLGLTGEATDPDYADDPRGKRIPLDAHIRLARPRTPPTEKKRMLRKGFNYQLGFDNSGYVNQGLAFVSYQRTLDAFMTIQMRLKNEPLEEYTLPFGGGFFFTLPWVQDSSDWLGRPLFA
jgi:deferrochelatase/peroxidase EfeB